jgi:hypothetical protein
MIKQSGSRQNMDITPAKTNQNFISKSTNALEWGYQKRTLKIAVAIHINRHIRTGK